MSLGSNFLTLIDKLWDVDRFDMWLSNMHGIIAYVLDRLWGTEQYQQAYDRLMSLSNNDTANEFAMYVCDLLLQCAKKDPKCKLKDIEAMERTYILDKDDYEDGALSTFGLLREEYFPDWFFELFGVYYPLEKMKREIAIKDAIENAGYSKDQSDLLYNKVAEQFDIVGELYYYVKTGRMKVFEPCTAERISAVHLYETICKTPLEAYLFLVYLREYPEQALAEYKKRINS